MKVRYNGIPCTDGTNVHLLKEVKDERYDHRCTKCGIKVYGDPGTTAMSEQV